MSGEIVTFVSQRKLGSPTRKAVLVQFAETANGYGKGIWKSHKTIASLVEISSRTVQRTIKDFTDEGLVIHTGYHTKNGITTKAYDLDLTAISKLPLVESESGFTPIELKIPEPEIESGQNGTYDTGDTFRDTGDIKPASGVTLTVPTALTVHSINTRARDARDHIGIVYANWNRMAEANGLSQVRTNTINAGRDKSVIRRLADCNGDIERLFQAIRNVPNNPHWIGQNGWRADFDWVFKPTNFHKALELDQPVNPRPQNERPNNQHSDSRFRKSNELDAATRLALANMGYGQDGECDTGQGRESENGLKAISG